MKDALISKSARAGSVYIDSDDLKKTPCALVNIKYIGKHYLFKSTTHDSS